MTTAMTIPVHIGPLQEQQEHDRYSFSPHEDDLHDDDYDNDNDHHNHCDHDEECGCFLFCSWWTTMEAQVKDDEDTKSLLPSIALLIHITKKINRNWNWNWNYDDRNWKSDCTIIVDSSFPPREEEQSRLHQQPGPPQRLALVPEEEQSLFPQGPRVGLVVVDPLSRGGSTCCREAHNTVLDHYCHDDDKFLLLLGGGTIRNGHKGWHSIDKGFDAMDKKFDDNFASQTIMYTVTTLLSTAVGVFAIRLDLSKKEVDQIFDKTNQDFKQANKEVKQLNQKLNAVIVTAAAALFYFLVSMVGTFELKQ
jgi:hypothetical protein